MTDTKKILKNAFIDSQLDLSGVSTHNFSEKFEFKMQRFIRSQQGMRKLINSAGKRVACIALAILICLITVACSIEEVREPIKEEIQKFFVNAKEILTGTAADEVSDFFPTDVTKIIGTSYISESENRYVIDEKEKVRNFIELLSQTYWGEPEWFEEFDEVNTYWTFDFFDSKGKSVFSIKMCNDISYERSKIAIIKDGQEKHFYISNKVYREILAFTNEKYYLHDSPIEEIDKEFFEARKTQSLYGIDESVAKEIKTRIRNFHYELEHFLMSNVSLLKEADSVYWEYVINENIFVDPISGTERKYDMNSICRLELEYIISATEDITAKEKLREALELWDKSVAEHDLSGLFKVHEYIHDYDYFAFNYPTHYVYSEYADYQGINDYFGKLG